MKQTRTWVLVADGARARIARSDGRGQGLRPSFNHNFADPRAPARRMTTDRAGRVADAGSGGSHAVGPQRARRDTEQQRFTRDLAGVLDRAARRRVFDRLVLVAPPATLGLLRASLTPTVRLLVAAEVGKDLTHLPLREVSRRLLAEMIL